MDLMKVFKQIENVQEKFGSIREEFADFETEGTSGGGMVRLTLTGKGVMSKLWIDPVLFKEDDKEILEDLIMAAYNDAKEKNDNELDQKTQEAIKKIKLPDGIKLPF